MNKFYSNKTSINYYKNNRSKIKHLYKSERFFFSNIAKKSNSFLDVGCALGNFVKIIKKIKKENFEYMGLDNQALLIKLAKKKFPNKKFHIIRNHSFPNNNNYDLVFSLGTLHHISYWRRYILSMKKRTKKYLLFDVRITKQNTINSDKQFQKITFGKKWDGKSKIRYITIKNKEFNFFLKKNFKNFKVQINKYEHKVGDGYVGIHKKVFMTTVLCKKFNKKNENKKIFK